MPLNALIVDDEEYSRKSLYFLLQENCPEINVGGLASSVAEARKIISENSFDVVFLDIAMPKENGFELIPQIKEHNTLVVFITAYDQYALKALKASAVDYLLKPIDISELQVAVKKCVERTELPQQSESHQKSKALNTLTDNLSDKSKIVKLTLPHSSGFHVIETSNILYIEADSNYSVFHLKDSTKLIVSRPLKEFEELLDNSDFARVHKSAIINLDYVSNFSNKHGLEVILDNEISIPVSRRRASEFQDKVKGRFQGKK